VKEPIWITHEVILATQVKLLDRFGGLEGIRDETLLDSALHRPQHLFRYGNPTLFEMAAAYAVGIVKNHPFVDGNKRAGFMAAYIFLGVNGCFLEATEIEAAERTLALAAGAIGEAEFTDWLAASCSPVK
jgi:death-on-curing protein